MPPGKSSWLRLIGSRILRSNPLRAHFKTWCDRCGVSVKWTVFHVGFLHSGSVLASFRHRMEVLKCALSSLGPPSCPYSPDVREGMFYEVRIARSGGWSDPSVPESTPPLGQPGTSFVT